jgi:signal transduction histidine kinase
MTLEIDADDLPDHIELAAYFIVSECLTNARRYAHAAGVTVEVRPDGETLFVTVADDGRGGADPDSGTGLRGLADRVDALGGALEIHSPPGAGTRITARLPLAQRGGIGSP